MIGLKKYTMFFGLAIGLLLSACGGENNTKIEEPRRDIIGKFIDSAVEGVEYRCGEIIDFTDENGTFSCITLPVSFYIGLIRLGELDTLPVDNQVFPQDIIDVNRSDINNSQVVKLALLLQSLDEDNNASNGIRISNRIRNLFDEEILLAEVTIDELKTMVQNKDENLTFKDIEDVINHLSFSVGITNETNTTIVIDNNNTETNTTIVIDNNRTETNTTIVIDNNRTETNTTIDNNTTVLDTTAPNIPTLTVTPTTTEQESINIEVNGEINSTIYVNTIEIIQIDNSGKATISLDTSGVDGNKTFNIILKDTSNNQSDPLVLTVLKTSAPVADTTPPSIPTIATIPKFTNQDSTRVEVMGEANTVVFVNALSSGSLNAQGVLSIYLNTLGDDGVKDFNLTLKDSSLNESPILKIKIIKDTIPPAENSTITSLTSDDTTPSLDGNLPSGDNDTNTTNYSISVKIDNENYTAINNKNGKWSIADNTIDTLEMGTHDVNITVTDEANNSSSTFLADKINVDNTGFLIDSALEGIKYISGAYSGYTDKDGLFKYDKGAGVTFYIGDELTGISLGTATEKIDPYNPQRRIITLFDLAGTQDENSTRVINMGKFLQSLDSDNDVSNGITIDDRTKESIALLGLKNRIDFDMDIETFHNHNDIYELFNDLAEHFGEHRGLISADDAKAHLVAVRDNIITTKSYKIEKISGEKEVIKVLEGVFKSVNGVVEGLEYRSGNQFGRTDRSGTFKYEEGKTVKFYIYQLELGITEAKAVVTPADLTPATSFDHPKPRNIIRLLNAFDAPNSANILIDNAVREALEKYRSQIDINLPDGKANAELSIPQGVDEFGAQFEDFEMGKDILDEIDRLRGQ